MRKLWLGATVLLLSTVVAFGPAPVGAAGPPAEAGQEAPSVADQLLVGFNPGTTSDQRSKARQQQSARLVETVASGGNGMARVELVALPAGRDESAIAERFERNPNVSFAERNWIYTTGATSNDPKYTDGSLWGMYGDDATSPVNQYGSQANEAWAAGNTGSRAVYIGIIDEGVQWSHPDLDANIWTNPRDAADGVDNDGNGYVDDVRGWDFNGNDNSTYDGTGDDHGTHVAGTIGAEGGNGTGVVGVSWNVTLITAKFLGPRGGTTANAVKAVDYLTDLKVRHGINLVATNNSWGGGGYSQTLYDAIDRANAADILFVAAAGNGGNDSVGDNNDATPHYPSSYEKANIISVAAIDSSGSKPTWSNYGATSVDLGAPGAGIWSTIPDKTYQSYSGTSMATPHVTGAVALWRAGNPSATAVATKQAIIGAAIPTASMAGKVLTGGRLNAGSFTTSPLNAAPSASFTYSCTGLTCSFNDTSTDSDGTIASRSWNFGDGSPSTEQNPSRTYTGGGIYEVTLTVTDDKAATGDDSQTVTVSSEPTSTITLSAAGRKVKSTKYVDLTWSGTNATSIDIYRDGSKVTTTAVVTYTYTDTIAGKGGGTYTYKVCEAGSTTVCSNDVSVTF